ncbi:MAG TPA: amidohydrolase family protein [Thermoanaerobaculia bacterium]|jgi:predicted TIM-barrel fold metal-dependent hydrolase
MRLKLLPFLLLFAFGSHAASGPVADHHAHLLSPAGAARITEPPLDTIAVPAELTKVIDEREQAWNNEEGLAKLYTDNAIVHQARNATWIKGRAEVAENLATLFAKQYRIAPVAYDITGNTAWVAGYFTRPNEGKLRRFGHVLLSLKKDDAGAWKIAAETLNFPGPTTYETVNAEQLIARHDEAGIKRAAVLSTAYWWGSPLSGPVENEYEIVRQQNDWTVSEVAKYPERLFAFISFNPLKDYALEELQRFAKHPNVRGLKLHFGNSGVDVKNPEHLEKVRRVFKAANEHKMGIIVHLWTGGPEGYGKEDAEIFLAQVLPVAPDIPITIAHFAGGGPGYTDEALAVYAEAIQKNDPRTKNLTFDIATVADSQSDAVLKKFAERIRQIGFKRVLFGTDLGPPHARQSWMIFRTTTPLTDEEFAAIAGNVAPYLAPNPAPSP